MANTPDPPAQSKRRRSPPWKLAPSDRAHFTLILLEVGCPDRGRVGSAVERVMRESDSNIAARLAGPLPWAVERGLSHADSLLGQFELACCDCISVFVGDEVVASASAEYLARLFAQLRASPEFELVPVRLESLPAGLGGRQFLARFLGRPEIELPIELPIMRKKARSMAQAADSLGARLMILSE